MEGGHQERVSKAGVGPINGDTSKCIYAVEGKQ